MHFARQSIYAILLGALLTTITLRGADWLTFGADPQRSGWAKHEDKISKENAKALSLQWKLQLDNQAKELNSLTAPIVVEQVYTARGVKDLVIIGGSSDNLYAIDADSGKVFWKKTFQVEGTSKQESHWLCPNALNATPVVEKDPKGLGVMTVHAVSSDGKLHSLNVINGEDRVPPKQFVPPFSKNWSLNVADGILYTTTSQGCNGARSAVYAMNLKAPDRPVMSFVAAPTGGGGIWGRAGAAVGTGRVFAETGDGSWDPEKGKYPDSVLAVSAGELKLVDYYTPANRAFITKKDLDMGNMSPIVFAFQQWELVAAAGKEGVIYLLDAKSLGGADHRTPLFRSPLYTNEDVDFAGRGFWGAFATSEDSKGTRWLYAPAWGPQASGSPEFAIKNGPAPNGSIMAFKVELKDGKPVLSPGWISRDLDVPEPPIVANGVVFALSSGENVRQLDSAGKLLSSRDRANSPRGNAVLYALDAETGKELFSSGKTMTSFTHFSGLAVASGKVFVTTYDCNVYSFGLSE
jgi:outer membrane protein assembly factor BamB